MRSCDMCGGLVSERTHKCEQCGMTNAENEVPMEEAMIGNPDWGRITIKFDISNENVHEVFLKIKEIWENMELKTAQRLFSGQLDNIVSPEKILEVYGPFESAARIRRELSEMRAESFATVEFRFMLYEDIYKIRDGA